MNSRTRLQLSVSLTVVAVALGMMVSIQYKQASTQRNLSNLTNATGSQTAQLTKQLTALQKESQAEQQQLQDITGHITTYEKKASTDDSKLKGLQQSLASARILAGTTAVEGPGIEFTVTDGTPPAGSNDAQAYLTHDWLVRDLINEMFLSGAEAVSVNGYRIVATSGIFCRGPVITVNGHRMTAPFDFKAIGDPQVMAGGLQMTGGEFDILRNVDHLQISPIQTKSKLIISAYTGTISAPPTTTGN